MSIKSTQETTFGENRELYIRLNNIEASNHGNKAYALFRGFLSKEAFDNGKPFVFEKSIELDVNVSGNLWEQAYVFIKTLPEFADAVNC
jgi:hypothetical protein